ncbi:hypothetical protein [Frateuria sp. STR12]|uniref:hypothetical protein n=1 Tax=Frateuria hangzhouensis TaxID=2995589 RepID=UPI002260DFEE|nr:hypothetical protein [Frateuria sp. STR12]MCX7514402.1 hypothetical protein [Frateuria sp. STR12]
MKIRLLCWSLLLASTFALAACNNGTNDNAEPGMATPATAPATAPMTPTEPMTPPPATTAMTPPATMPPPSSTAMPAPTSTTPNSSGGSPN